MKKYLLLALFVMNCGRPADRHFSINAEGEKFQLVSEAIEEINLHAGCTFLTYDQDLNIQTAEDGISAIDFRPTLPEIDDAAGITHLYRKDFSPDIEISDEKFAKHTDPSVKRFIIQHEIGHLLGLEHSQSSVDIMYPSLNNWFWLGDATKDASWKQFVESIKEYNPNLCQKKEIK